MNNKAEPKNILVVRTDRIGDVILTTPAIHALRQRFPGSRISLLIAPLTYDLVNGNPDIDEILVDNRSQEHRGWRGFWKLVRQIKEKQFDLVINFHTKKRSNLLCFFAKIPRRVGYRNNKLGFLLTEKVADVRPKGEKHEAQYCLDVLNGLGVEGGELTPFIPVQGDAERWAEHFFEKFHSQNPQQKFVVLHVESSCPTKRWPIQYFADVIRKMDKSKNLFFIVIGTDREQDGAVDLWKLSGKEHFIYNLIGKTSLAQTVSMLKRCDLLISNDSGPVHIAAAFDTPVISIFTRNQPGINPERWRPLGPNSHYVCPAVDMDPSFEKGEISDHGFLYRVTPQQVLDVVDAVF